MKRETLFIFIAAFLSLTCASAQTSRIATKDDAIYDGYIANQTFTKESKITIQYEKVVKNIKIEGNKETESRVAYLLSDMSQAWSDWAKSNGAVEIRDGKEFITLSSWGSSAERFYVLEKSATQVRAISFDPSVNVVLTSSIAYVQNDKRDPMLLTFADDVVKTSNKTYVGQIIEQVPGEHIKIYSTEDNTTYVFAPNEIVSKGKLCDGKKIIKSEYLPYLEQLVFADEVTEYGYISDDDSKTGLISFIVLNGQSYLEKSYPADSLRAINKKLNPDYRPIYDVKLEKGCALLNGMPLKKVSTTEYRNGLFYVIKDSTLQVFKMSSPEVLIQAACEENGEDFYLIPAQVRMGAEKFSWYKQEDVCLLCYSYKDLHYAQKLDYITSRSGVARISFNAPNPGYYFIYRKGSDETWLFELTY